MEKFATAFAVPVTEEQYKRIAPKLEKMGYKNSDNWGQDSKFLVNNFNGRKGEFGTAIFHDSIHMSSRIMLPEFNEDLVLALAAIPGEYCYNWRKEFVKRSDGGVAACGKPTAQELIDHFSKPKKREYDLASILDKLDAGWTLTPPPVVKLDPDLEFRADERILIKGWNFGVKELRSMVIQLAGIKYSNPGLMINKVFYSSEELQKILDKYHEIYSTPGMASESAPDSIR